VTKRILLALVLSVLTAGVVFSQTDFKDMAKNTITVDFGPTIMGGLISAAGGIAKNMLEEDVGISSSGFGIAAQYERQLLKNFSVAGRFSYLGGNVGFSDSVNTGGATVKTDLGVNIYSFSIEGHARYYPWGKTFFLDGMLGYANMKVNLSGKIVGTGTGGYKEEMSADMAGSQGFFALGAKFGWRISFGKKGGFTFEPSLGYVYGIGSGDTIWDQLSKKIREKNNGANIEDGGIAQIFDIVQNYVFVGGPRLSLAFGWRF